MPPNFPKYLNPQVATIELRSKKGTLYQINGDNSPLPHD